LVGGGVGGKNKDLRPGIVLTFDDAYVAQWQAAMPIFRKYGAQATFFVASPQNLSPERVAGLQELAAAGHAIGCHSWRHLRAVDVLKAHTAEEYVAMEATPALAKLRQMGFSPTCYGYPSSSRTADTDRELLKQFRHLRTGGMPAAGRGLAESDEFFTKTGDMAKRGCLLGKGIDRAGEEGHPDRAFREIFAAMERAKTRGEIIVFYAHNIADGGPGHYLAPAALERILAKAKELGLAFHTYDDLP
jgi:peptidoglycan/xylan/chitin deacetylase (PgdA/CDA1 family)